MCGIVLAVGDSYATEFVRRVNEMQKHRGPDGQHEYLAVSNGANVAIGHQRLAILDLSDRGRQPMVSHSGRYVMSYNGEVYNYRALAKEFHIENRVSGTDSEVVLELIEMFGIEKASYLFNGMWALAVYDVESGRTYLSRDRFGKKPLYYTVFKNTIYVASETKSFSCIRGLALRVNPKVAARYLAQSLQDIDCLSWLQGVHAFPAACTGFIDAGAPHEGVQDVTRYWRIDPAEGDSPTLSNNDYVEQLRETVQDAVALRLHADVPVGIALSGGLDSSIISAAANNLQERTGQSVELFSAVHPGSQEDESPFIDIVAGHLGRDVHKFSLAGYGGQEVVDLLQSCLLMNDGPVASFSEVLFYKLMQLARGIGVKVVLTGQGADEVFCGYRKYPLLEIRRLLSSSRIYAAAKMMVTFAHRGTMIGQFNIPEAKRYLGSVNRPLLGPSAVAALTLENLRRIDAGLGERQLLDIEKYSVPYLTHYEDRMSMAWSREIRAPFLDYRVVEMGVKAEPSTKLRHGWTKYCLRKAFNDSLPAEIIWRKDKQGFANPQGIWVKTILKEPIEAMIADNDSPVFAEGLVNRDGYSEMYARYCSGSSTIWFRDMFAPFVLNTWMKSLR